MTGKLNVVVAGGGRVGFQTATLLADRGNDVTIIERDEAVVSNIADEWLATVIHGDATKPGILEQAAVDDADVVAALTGESGQNLAICMIAEEIAGDVRTVARIEDADGEDYTRLVDAVVFPEHAGARLAASEIEGSDVQTLADVTSTLDILRIRVEEGAPAAGKTLSEINFPAGTLVISGAEGEHIARPDTILEPGTRYVVAVEPDVADEVMNLLRG